MLVDNYKISLKFFRIFLDLFLIKSNKDKYKVAQRVLNFKKKTRLTVMSMHSKLLNNDSMHPLLSESRLEEEKEYKIEITPECFDKLFVFVNDDITK